MSRLLKTVPALVLTAGALASGPALASDFMNTTVTFYLGDDNLLVGAAQDSPTIGLGNAYPELFFEGLNALKPKVVTETHLVNYGRLEGYIPGLVTEAALVLEMEVYRDPDENRARVALQDDGSYARVAYYFDHENLEGNNFSFTGFPYNSRVFLLGYTYDLSWGSERIYPTNRSAVPGFKFNLDLGRGYAFAGMKTAIRMRDDLDKPDTEHGVLFGGGVEIIEDMLTWDIGLGYFTRGTFPDVAFESHELQARGLSTRISFNRGPALGLPVDFRLFRNDPTQGTGTRATNYDGGFAVNVSGEFTVLQQNLQDPEVYAQTRWVSAIAAAVRGKIRTGGLRVGLDFIYRDVYFLTFNIPGVTPYRAFPANTELNPQVYGALFLDYYIERARLTPGIRLGVMRPASFIGSSAADAGGNLVVVRDENDIEILPEGYDKPFIVISAKVSARWELSRIMALIVEGAFTWDRNNTRATAAGSNVDTSQRVLDEDVARQLGLNVLLQARF